MRFSNRHCGILAIWLCASASLSQAEQCQPPAASLPAFHSDHAKREGELTLFADEVTYLENRQLQLSGRVEMQAGQFHATSEHADLNQAAQQAELKGDIRIRGPQILIEGEQAHIDMQSQIMRVDDVHFLNPATGMRGSAASLQREQTRRLAIHEGYFTTCEGEQPDWSIAASDIELDNDSGFGTAKHARFEVLGTPVLYVPWFTFPIDERRKTGFLYPSLGSANTGSGIQISTPYYFNLAPDLDATLTPSHINERGWHTGLEFRHLSTMVSSQVVAGYLEADDFYRQEQQAQGFGRPEAERWGLSLAQQYNYNETPTGWQADLEYRAVSDNDYLDDLNLGLYTGQNDALNRELHWLWAEPQWRLHTKLQQIRQLDDTLTPEQRNYQRLPEIDFAAANQWGHWLGTWHSQYVYFYRDNSALSGQDASIGSRLRHQPSLSYPIDYGWASLQPRITLDHTDYLLQDYPPEDNHQSRTLLSYELDSRLYLGNTHRAWSRDLHHSLEPRLYYVYRDAKTQDHLPNFDTTVPGFNYARLFEASRFSGGDRVGDMNRLSIGVQSHWYDQSSGRELAQFNLGQMLHFEDREVTLTTAGLDAFGGQTSSSSFYASELLLRPTDRLSLTLAGLWDDTAHRTHEGWTQVGYRSADHRSVLNLSHRYRAEDLEQSDVSFITPLSNTISLLGKWRFDLQAHRTLGTLAGMEYQSCCWRVQVFAQSYLDDDSQIKRSVQLRFHLKGLGGFGANTESLDQQIPGYQAREELIH